MEMLRMPQHAGHAAASSTVNAAFCCAAQAGECCCLAATPPAQPALGVAMKPSLRPSNPARSSFFSRRALRFSARALMRPSMFSLRLRQHGVCAAAGSLHRASPLRPCLVPYLGQHWMWAAFAPHCMRPCTHPQYPLPKA